LEPSSPPRSANAVDATDAADATAAAAAVAHAEKMRALARLAEGVARELDQVTAGVTGQLALVAEALQRGDVGRAAVELHAAEAAAGRGSALSRKLLGFGRRQALRPQLLRASAVLDEAGDYLRVHLPPAVRLETRVVEDGWIEADPALVEDVLVNLAMNARDAMPEGGLLRVEATRRLVDPEFVADTGWGIAGEYMVIRVRDTGAGIAPGELGRVLDPFYSTSGAIGLGLAMVYGLMKQHGGWIDITSTPASTPDPGSASPGASGTAVELLFPYAATPAGSVDADLVSGGGAGTEGSRAGIRSGGGTERILVAEDDEATRDALTRVLRRAGYTVRATSDGAQALEMLRVWPECELVVTDVAMPELGGAALYRALRGEGILTPVLFTSGEASTEVRRAEGLPPRSVFLPKPWTVTDLLARVRRALAVTGRQGPRG
jgi:two-component system, cell cycle sensor histidine kinase and response regulator CckA